MRNYASFQQHIGYTFKKPYWLEAALTHGSIRGKGNQFERLEFLGDRILGVVVADALFNDYPHAREGELAKRFAALVCKDACEDVAKRVGLQKLLKMATPENMQGSAVLADATEALIGAIYCDGGPAAARHFIHVFWAPFLEGKQLVAGDYKSLVQEWTQAHKKGLPVYEALERTGPDHAPTYTVRLTIVGFETITGQGASKKQAEQEVAKAFCTQHINPAA
jgi:ribonuclease-3